mmetsp:Transcript_89476/g.213793  ORF Transcript_89476/g.213793 Transcript_89476/m.213793 type:complete len:229 (+) Transcript_89476:1434-2120(+)
MAVCESQATQNLSNSSFGRICTDGLKLCRGVLEIRAHPFQIICGDLLSLLHGCLHVLQLLKQVFFSLDQLRRPDVRCQHFFNCRPLRCFRFLFHQNDVPIDRHRHLTRRDVPQQRGLSLTIRSEDAIAVALNDGDARIVEQSLLRRREREVVADESIARRRRLVLATLKDDAKSIHSTHRFIVLVLVHDILLLMLVVSPLLLVRQLLSSFHLLEDCLEFFSLGWRFLG